MFADGRQGPDAMQVIEDIHGNRGIPKDAVQIKIAKTSEAVPQTILDQYRSVGLIKAGPTPPVLLYTPTGQTQERMLPLVMDPRVSRRLVIINALDSRIPAGDLVELDVMGMPVDERLLGWTVDQNTRIGLVVLQATLEHALKVGKIK